jgi:dTDP-4-dehydrorhamnose 3,5-epimerase
LIFQATPIDGVRVVELERLEDERGYFARTWCRQEFAGAGIADDMVQMSVSHNAAAGTLRGMHFSWVPSREAKLVRCTRGQVFDVVLDLRPTSPSFLQHYGVVLADDNGRSLYIPQGVAHGFQTLVEDCDVLYMMSDFYRPELADGVRFDDPQFGIAWPRPVSRIAERDRDYPDFDASRHAARFGAAGAGNPCQ